MITALDKNTALVLVDLQKGIVQIPLARPVIEILKNAASLVEAFRKAQLPIVIVKVNPAGGGRTAIRAESSPMRNMPLKQDWLEITPEINVLPGDLIITKHTWSAFFETPLHEELKKRSITGIVLAGISTSIGVEGTARGANERGYNITFASDAMTDRAAEAHEHSMKYIFPRIGEIDDTEKIIAFIESGRVGQ